MAIIYATASGQVARVAGDDGTLLTHADPLPAAPQSLDLDGGSNAALLADCAANPGRYLLTSGTLTRDGQAVVIAAPSATYTQRQQVITQAQQIVDDLTAYLALGSPTNAQTVAAFREVAQAVRYFIRHFVLDAS